MVTTDEDTGCPEPHEEPVDIAGVAFRADLDTVLTEFEWLDPLPTPQNSFACWTPQPTPSKKSTANSFHPFCRTANVRMINTSQSDHESWSAIDVWYVA